MKKGGAKAARKFAKSGELKRTIDNRRKHQKLKKQIQARKAVRGAPLTRAADPSGDVEGEMDDDRGNKGKRNGKERAKAVDFLDEDDAHPNDEDEKTVSNGR
jgi:nucleolar complex protein 2